MLSDDELDELAASPLLVWVFTVNEPENVVVEPWGVVVLKPVDDLQHGD